MSGDGDEAERLQVLEQYRKKVGREAKRVALVLLSPQYVKSFSRLFLERALPLSGNTRFPLLLCTIIVLEHDTAVSYPPAPLLPYVLVPLHSSSILSVFAALLVWMHATKAVDHTYSGFHVQQQ